VVIRGKLVVERRRGRRVAGSRVFLSRISCLARSLASGSGKPSSLMSHTHKTCPFAAGDSDATNVLKTVSKSLSLSGVRPVDLGAGPSVANCNQLFDRLALP